MFAPETVIVFFIAALGVLAFGVSGWTLYLRGAAVKFVLAWTFGGALCGVLVGLMAAYWNGWIWGRWRARMGGFAYVLLCGLILWHSIAHRHDPYPPPSARPAVQAAAVPAPFTPSPAQKALEEAGQLSRRARNPSCPPAELAELSRRPEWGIRINVARNPSAPEDVLTRLAADENPKVRDLAAPSRALHRVSARFCALRAF